MTDPRAAAMSEKDLTECVAGLARLFGMLRYHTHRSDRSPAGFPDEVLVGRTVLFRELKRQGGRVSKPQQEWITRLTAAGQDAAIWWPDDWFSGRIHDQMLAAAGRAR